LPAPDRRGTAELRLAAATLCELAAALVLIDGKASALAWAVATLAHACAVPLAAAAAPPGSRRELTVGLVLALPVVGAMLAMLALSVRGGSGELAAEPAQPDDRPLLTPEEARRLAADLPTCEALTSRDERERRSALARLQHRGDAQAIRVLRWALGRPDPDLVLEAALTLEDLGGRHEARVQAARATLIAKPTFEQALATADLVAEAVFTGLADAALLPAVAQEARCLYELAEGLAGADRVALLAERRARLELAALCPGAALSEIERAQAGDAAAEARLAVLREDAALAARRFALLPRSVKVRRGGG
jgi:hypothetical protein